MEKVEIQITKGLTEETTEGNYAARSYFGKCRWIKGIFGIDKSCDFRECRIYLLEKKKLLAILQVEEDDLDEMMKKIIDDIIRSQIEIIEKEHKKTGFKIVSIFEMVTYDPEEGLTTQITKAVKPYLKNLI